jgi:branched-chain amino acid transport system ATP-binding protein
LRDHYHLTILLVEHQMRLVMNICDEILVVNFGQKMVVGKPEEIRNNQEVLEAYLGKRN